MTRDTKTDLRASGGPTWKWVTGILLTIVLAGASYIAGNVFYSRAEAATLEAEYNAHCREAEYRHLIQAEQNHRVNQSIRDINTEQRRMNDNIIRIGEKLRVRDLDTGEP